MVVPFDSISPGFTGKFCKKDIVAVAARVVYMKYTKTTGHPVVFIFRN
jgi:hypothetical protein